MAASQGSTQAMDKAVAEPRELGGLYADLSPELRRYAWRLTHNDADAEDLVNQAFANTLAAVEGGSVLEHPRPWMYRCVLNLALERKRHDPPASLDEAPEMADHHSTVEAVELHERCTAINQAAGDLPEHLRRAFVLAEVRGLSYAEIAGDMRRSIESVRSLLARARSQVRATAGHLEVLVSPVIGLVQGAVRGIGRRTRGGTGERQEQLASWLGTWPAGGPEIAGKSIVAAALVVAGLVAAGTGVQTLRKDLSGPGSGRPDAVAELPQAAGGAPVAGDPAAALGDRKSPGADKPDKVSGNDQDGKPSAASPQPGSPGKTDPAQETAGSPQADSAGQGNASQGGNQSGADEGSDDRDRVEIGGTAVRTAPGSGSSPSTATATAPVPAAAGDPFGPATEVSSGSTQEPVAQTAPAESAPAEEGPSSPFAPSGGGHRPRPSSPTILPRRSPGDETAGSRDAAPAP